MISPRAGRPWLILHRASDSAAALGRGRAAAADYLELDVWLEGSRVALRHDPLLIPGFPWLTRRRVLPLPRLRRFWLDGVGLEGRVFLDLKYARPELVDRCVSALRSAGGLADATASTPIWAQLDYLARLAPEIDRFYSIGRGDAGTAAWRRYEERVETGRACRCIGNPRRRSGWACCVITACARFATRSTISMGGWRWWRPVRVV
ncbi:MAG: hypothetical protein DK306_002270 [Chloroflexi bacterium]|nr:MAG: hypothetical protein DK306_002270 [Chloroflexota bacterium]